MSESFVNLMTEVLSKQLEASKQNHFYTIKKLSEVVSEYEAQYNDMLKTEKLLEMYFRLVMKRVRNSRMAQKQELIIIRNYIKTYKQMETNSLNDLEKIYTELEEIIKKLIREIERSG